MANLNSPFYFYSLILASCLGSLSLGYQFGIYNTCAGEISAYYSFSEENKQLYEGLITSSISLGGIVGAFYSSSLIKLGRRHSLILTDIFSIISTLFCFLPGFFSLILSRLLSGVCLGLNSVIIPIFIKEFSPADISGSTGSLHSVFISGGILLSFFFGFFMPYSNILLENGISLWKLMFGFPILISMSRIYLLMRFFTFETPAFLWKKRKEYEARSVMESLYSEEMIFELTKSFNKVISNPLRFTDLFGPIYVNQMKFGLILSITQQLSGINALIFYSNQIFKQDGSETIATIFTFLIGVILTLTAVISGKFMDHFGRRKAMIYGDLFCVIFLGVLVVFKTTPLAFLNKYVILLFVFSFGVSLGPILWVYLSETLPEKGVSLATLVNWMASLFISLVFPKMITFLNFEGTFAFFFICGLMGLIYIYFNMIETKGLNEVEISKIGQYDVYLIF